MILLSVLWIAWCTLHSVLISQAAHKTANRLLRRYYPIYRLLYVGFSFLSLVPVLWYHFSLPQQVLLQSNFLFRVVQLVLLLYSGFMFLAGARVYDMGYFLGLAQWRNFHNKSENMKLPFHSDGILAYVRHPWYSGGIAFLWGLGSCTDVYLVTRLILTAYFIIGAYLEENRLKGELGSQYRQYCRNVPMLFPWKICAKVKGGENIS